MKKNCDCEYSPLCGKMEMIEQPQVFYWPRDPRLKPYCRGAEDSSNCNIYRFWGDNPEIRERMRNLGSPDSCILPGAIVTGAGAFLCTSDSITMNVLGAAYTALGVGCLARGISMHYTGKKFFKWLKTRKERPGTQEIYNKIVETADSSEEIGPDSDDIFNKTGPIATKRLPNLKDAMSSFPEPRNVEWKGTRFSTAKISLSYPLTEDCSIMQEGDWGVVVLYEYEKSLSPNSDFESEPVKSCYMTGVIEPVINRGRVTEGEGFIGSMMHRTLPLGVSPIIEEDRIGIAVSGLVTTMPWDDFGSIDKIFGSQRRFDSVAKSCMDEKTAIDARNVHKLMQEVLYSDF